MIKNIILLLPLLFLSSCESTPAEPVTNGSVMIQYSVEKRTFVLLTIENAYGTRMRTLVEKEQDPGIYSTLLALEGMAEGMYYYVLDIGSEQTIRRHFLVKMP
ncbi:MAG: hypothetical protein HUU02_14655 [Bacteroidetes bacterium]|nr:hypothetical protein [Bacteroidota bacterium]